MCPPNLPFNHPSFIELEENDNVVKKYKETVMSVCNILTNDQLNQEVSLKKKLAASGKVMSHSLVGKTETTPNAVSFL